MASMDDELFPAPGRRGAASPERQDRTGRSPSPLADRLRPRTLEDLVGQTDLLAPGRPLRRLIESDAVPSLILWGPPGCGKTTLARLIAARADVHFLEYSAVAVGAREVREAMATARKLLQASGRRTLLFLDEIHRFNRAQQDSLLPWVERGDITLIGATTENPSFEVIGALLSRTRLFVLSPLSQGEIEEILRRALIDPRGLAGAGPDCTPEALTLLARLSGGDARIALNLLESAAAAAAAAGTDVGEAHIRDLVRRRALRHDKTGDDHHALISALHKSMRNSDAQAAVYWLARLLEGGEDPLYVARRFVRFASEDVGLADPQALPQALAARDAAHFVGMPEAALALAQAAVYLALAHKSNALYTAYGAAAREIAEGAAPPVPLHLRNAPTELLRELGYGRDYTYAHDTADGVADMPCLPDGMGDRIYYKPSGRGFEATLAQRLANLAAWRASRRAGEKNPTGGDA